jgi:hypothetical protein
MTDRDHALYGPRALKERGSAEWCWQTIDYLKAYMRHVSAEWRQAEEVLDELTAVRAWEKIPPGQPYGTLNKMLQAEIGLNKAAITRAIRKAELAAHGGDRRSPQFQGDNITLVPSGDRGTSEAYIIRRLRRDRPDLAERVEHGELSANAAMVQMGKRPHKIAVNDNDPQQAARILRKYYTDPEQRKLLAKLLTEQDT